MADFFQTGIVPTLHRLKPDSVERLETDLERYARNRPIGLLLPALVSEFENTAMQRVYLGHLHLTPTHREREGVPILDFGDAARMR